MGPSDSKSNNQFAEIMRNYKVVKRVPEYNLSYLESLNPEGKDAVSREYTNLDKNTHQRKVTEIQQHKKVWDNTHLVRIIQYLTSTEDQYCSTSFKIYALFEYPHRTLNEQIIERSTQRQRFQEKELWSIIASCILGMSHLQKNNVRHFSLTSESILVDGNGVIKVSDPFCTSDLPNYDKVLKHKNNEHIYLSPQLCESLERAEVTLSSEINPFKSDVFTFGMIIMEAALLKYQDDCYREENTKINWDTIKYNLEQIAQIYSPDMKEMVRKLLLDVKERPDWLQLKQFMKDDTEDKKQQVKQQRVQYQQIPQIVQQRTVNVSHLGPRPQSQHLNYQSQPPIQSLPPNYIQGKPLSYVVPQAIPQPVHVNQTNQSIHHLNQQVIQIVPIQPSNLNHVRPSLGTRPADTYITKTRIDQNLIEVSDDEEEVQSSEDHLLHDQSNKQFKPLPYQVPSGVQNLPPGERGYLNPKGNIPTAVYPNSNSAVDSRYKYSSGIPVASGLGNITSAGLPSRDIYSGPSVVPGQRYVSNLPLQGLPPGGAPSYSMHSNVNRSIGSSNHGVGFTAQNNSSTTKPSDSSSLFTDYSKLGINRSNYDITSNVQPAQTYSQSHYTKVEDVKQGSRPVSVHKDSKNNIQSPTVSGVQVQRVVQTFSQGSRYQGEKVNGMRHGKGKFYYQDGGLYDGEWRENKMCGKGKLFYQSGKIAYEGDWDNDQFTGYGILYNQYPQSLNSPYNYDDFDNMQEVWTKFQGNFVDDMKQGQGKLFFSNGEYYEGNFDGDLVGGKGTFHTLQGESINGLWNQNHLVKKLN